MLKADRLAGLIALCPAEQSTGFPQSGRAWTIDGHLGGQDWACLKPGCDAIGSPVLRSGYKFMQQNRLPMSLMPDAESFMLCTHSPNDPIAYCQIRLIGGRAKRPGLFTGFPQMQRDADFGYRARWSATRSEAKIYPELTEFPHEGHPS